MQITTITYTQRKVDSHSEETLEATIQLPEGADPVECTDQLRDFIRSRLNLEPKFQKLERQHQTLQDDIAAAKATWEKIEYFYQKLGISPDQLKSLKDITSDDIPF